MSQLFPEELTAISKYLANLNFTTKTLSISVDNHVIYVGEEAAAVRIVMADSCDYVAEFKD